MLVLGGPAGVLKRWVASVCRPHASVSAFLSLLAEMRTVLLQTRPLFEVDFAGRGAYAGVCGCPTKGTDPSYLICCVCFVLA